MQLFDHLYNLVFCATNPRLNVKGGWNKGCTA